MKITIFGASGLTGLELVNQALTANHHLKALVRNPSHLTVTDEKFTIIRGDVLDSVKVDLAINAADVVVSTLGSRPNSPPNLLTQATQNLITSMHRHSVKRLLVQSSFPMSGSPKSMAFLNSLGLADDQLNPMLPLIADKSGQEKLIRESDLDWTIIQPLILTNDPRTGIYRAHEELQVKPGDTISRADVADFILKNISLNSEFTHKTVMLSY